MLPLMLVLAAATPQVPRADLGDRVTIHYAASLPDGRSLADSERRGLAYTFVVGCEPLVRPFDWLVRGMAAGEEKIAEVSEEDAFGPEGVPPIVPPHATLTVRLRVVRILKPPPPKVDSPDAE